MADQHRGRAGGGVKGARNTDRAHNGRRHSRALKDPIFAAISDIFPETAPIEPRIGPMPGRIFEMPCRPPVERSSSVEYVLAQMSVKEPAAE